MDINNERNIGLLNLDDDCLSKILDLLDFDTLKNVNECCSRLYYLSGESFRKRENVELYMRFRNNVMTITGPSHAKRFRRFVKTVLVATYQPTLTNDADFATFVGKNCGTPTEIRFWSHVNGLFDNNFGNRIAANLAKATLIDFSCQDNLNRAIYPWFKHNVLQNSNLVKELEDKSGILPTVPLTRLELVTLFISNEHEWIDAKLRLHQFIAQNRESKIKIKIQFAVRPSESSIASIQDSFGTNPVEVI